jgi:hypothetical protein
MNIGSVVTHNGKPALLAGIKNEETEQETFTLLLHDGKVVKDVPYKDAMKATKSTYKMSYADFMEQSQFVDKNATGFCLAHLKNSGFFEDDATLADAECFFKHQVFEDCGNCTYEQDCPLSQYNA